jgi:hypothetical protein
MPERKRIRKGRPEWCKEIACPFFNGECNAARAILNNYRLPRREEMNKSLENMVKNGEGEKVIDWCEREFKR